MTRERDMNTTDLRSLAVRAVEAGADALQQALRRTGWDEHRKVSKEHVDLAVEKRIRDVLQRGTPHIPVLGEETGGQLAERSWIVDPIDGTVNLLRGLPHVGISVGLLVEAIPVVGAVGAPLLGELWSAGRGQGAHDRTGQRLRVRALKGPKRVTSTGPPPPEAPLFTLWLGLIETILHEGADIRRCGSASVDLAYAAAGVVDGHLELGGLTAEASAQEELGLGLWDVAAGALLVIEAGGRATNWEGSSDGLFGSADICAGAPEWHEWALDLIRRAAPAGRRGTDGRHLPL